MKIIDNVNARLGDDLKGALAPGSRLSVAASCFSIYAYECLKAELESVEALRFVFSSPAFVPEQVADKLRKERREFHIPKLDRENSLCGTAFELRLKNELTQKAIARECAEWIRRKATFRSNVTTAPMQQFATVAHAGSSKTYLPLHGFTAVDLGYEKGNAVSNYVNLVDDAASSRMYLDLFDQIWADADRVRDVTEQVCEHISTAYKENAPELIYFLILYNIFNEFLEDISEDVLPNDRTGYEHSLIWKKLFAFQRDAAVGIINKLERYDGCILADSVGLGKTFTALAVIKYYELRNRSVLVLCPKKLAATWTNFNQNVVTNIFERDRFNYTVLCHTDLQRERGESLGVPLDRINWGNFDLVVIDESHNFRNNDAFKDRETRYQKLMRQVIQAGVKTKVLMLSATPVNNRFTDLRNQLALAYEGNPKNLQAQLRSEKDVNEIFRHTQAAFNAWSRLPVPERTPESLLNTLDFDFFELLDAVTIARSRRHIEKFYDMSEIGRFPDRLPPLSFHCPLAEREDVIGFNTIFEQLIALKMAVYAPFRYILPSRLPKYEKLYDTEVKGGLSRLKQADRERSLQALMTVNLLKRLESSVEAFRLTLTSLQSNHTRTLRLIADFDQTGRDGGIADLAAAYENMEPDDEDTFDPEISITGGKIKISLSDMDLTTWERELSEDLAIIGELLDEMHKISPADDSKLQRLKQLIEAKIHTPLNAGNRKVLVFSAFADTVNYLYRNLSPWFMKRYGLNSAKVTGSGDNKSTVNHKADFQTLLMLFSPISNEKAALLPNEPSVVDLLIATDCVSEGQNLQDCDYLVNYDIHWNPVRIIQRFGRIDRIGSRNEKVQLVNFWPDITLDEYINLKERVENRMVIADVTATGDDNVLREGSNELAFRKAQLKRLQEEVLDLEDLRTGVSITDLGLNDFRMDLVHYVKANGDLGHMPKGLHAIVPADPDKGILPGAIFVLRNTNHGVNIDQQNRLHPYYLVYIGLDGGVQVRHTEVKRTLDLLRAACKGRSEPLSALFTPFNRETRDGRKMDAWSRLLKESIHSIVDVKEENDLQSLFSAGGTSALVNTISGLDDFELTAFLVVREAP